MRITTKLMLVALIAFAAGGTCPSDVNNDGTVGINDFLQLLGDWGPCPNATVVGVGAVSLTADVIVRVWSDGLVEFKATVEHPDTEPQAWTSVPANPNAPRSRPVAASAMGITIYRLWADGTVDSILFTSNPGVVLPTPNGWITEPN